MIVKLFQRRFASLVQSGEKLHTVRPEPKNWPKIGETISLREWSGLPYRSKQNILGEGIITAVHQIYIDVDFYWLPFFTMTCRQSLDGFARRDGFSDWNDLIAWFQAEHQLPFKGTIIYWKLSSTESKSDATFPPTGNSSETPRGLGRDGNNPLMKNRKGQDRPSPIGKLAATLSGGSK